MRQPDNQFGGQGEKSAAGATYCGRSGAWARAVSGAGRRNPRRRWVALLLLVSIAVSAAGCLPSLPHDIYGLYTLKDTTSLLDGGIVVAGNACVGGGGYRDIGTDTLVTVKDENGTQLGQTTLGQGSGDSVKCEFVFVLKGIPDNAKSYVFVVGHRGSVTRSHDELAADNWTVGISLGS